MTESVEQENERLRRQLSIAGVFQPPVADMPSPTQLQELRSMVLKEHAVTLSCTIEQFERALLVLCYLRRQPKLNSEFYPTHWLDVSREWLRRAGYSTDINLRAVVAAAIASGVAYSSLARWPFDLELGLGRGDVPQPSSAWRQVLEAGKLPPPTSLNRQTVAYREQHIDMIKQPTDGPGVRVRR